jgi:hypothetical protein
MQEDDDLKNIVWVFITFFILYYSSIMVLHFKNKSKFPISERSPKISALNSICSLFYISNLLVGLYFSYSDNNNKLFCVNIFSNNN